MRLDQSRPAREVVVARGQCPDRAEMVGKEGNGVDGERAPLVAYRKAARKSSTWSVSNRDRRSARFTLEETGPAFDAAAAITRHGRNHIEPRPGISQCPECGA
jgi:hypothetical protein